MTPFTVRALKTVADSIVVRGRTYEATLAYSKHPARSGTLWRIRLVEDGQTYDPVVFKLQEAIGKTNG
jgi:hypothetical protein